MSENKYNPSTPLPTAQQIVQLAKVPPRAVLQIIVTAEGQLGVQYSGPMDRIFVQGILAEGKDEILARMRQQQQGPKVEVAPAGLKVA